MRRTPHIHPPRWKIRLITCERGFTNLADYVFRSLRHAGSDHQILLESLLRLVRDLAAIIPDPPKRQRFTGHCSEIAMTAADLRYTICVNYRQSRIGADETVREINSLGAEAFSVQADVSVESEVLDLFAAIDRRLGPVTHLVNNAGVLESQIRVQDVTADRLARIFATNVTGSFLCCREAIKRMSTRHGGQGGSIVNVSSAASRLGSAGEYVDYAASKGAITLTIGLANEVAGEGIRVNAVRPAFIHTGIHARGGEPGRIERLRRQIPLGRGGLPRKLPMQFSGFSLPRPHTPPADSSTSQVANSRRDLAVTYQPHISHISATTFTRLRFG